MLPYSGGGKIPAVPISKEDLEMAGICEQVKVGGLESLRDAILSTGPFWRREVLSNYDGAAADC